MECEIILTGNELLIGKTKDTNAVWIIDQLTPLGIQITQVTIIPDNLNAISRTISNALNRKPDYIFTSGGLGPTFDDMTIKGISQGLPDSSNMEENVEAIQLIMQRYRSRFPDLTDKQIRERYEYIPKMATFPKGGQPLQNKVGTAPGVLITPLNTNGKTTIIAMPGIPAELQDIFTNHVLPRIKDHIEDSNYQECGFHFINLPESGFAKKIYQIKDNYPDLWIKTHPKRAEMNKWEIELHISTFIKKDDIGSQLSEVYNSLLSYVKEKGGKILNTNPPS